MDIDWITSSVQASCYLYSRHADKERQNDQLSMAEVEQALLSCSLLEAYPDTGRGESCLVVGFTNTGIPVHVVCGTMRESLVLITVYIPTLPKFRTPYERA